MIDPEKWADEKVDSLCKWRKNVPLRRIVKAALIDAMAVGVEYGRMRGFGGLGTVAQELGSLADIVRNSLHD